MAIAICVLFWRLWPLHVLHHTVYGEAAALVARQCLRSARSAVTTL